MSTETSGATVAARRLWHVVRAVFFMLRKGVCKRKILLDLRLLLRQGKVAGEALAALLSSHHHHDVTAAFSCRYMDPSTSFYAPREVEFSCSNTPAFAFAAAGKRKRRHGKRFDGYDAAAIAKVFDILNEVEDEEVVAASPSPMLVAPPVRQLRISDSPFPLWEEEGTAGGVDGEAEEFIRKFYEQLRRQPAATPLAGRA